MMSIKRTILFLCMASATQNILCFQLSGLFSRALPIIAGSKIGLLKINQNVSSLPVEQSGATINIDIDQVVTLVKEQIVRMKRAHEAELRATNAKTEDLKKLYAGNQLSREDFENKIRDLAFKLSRSEENLRKVEEHVQKTVESHLGKAPAGMGNWSDIVSNPLATAQALEKINQASFSQDPLLKAVRAAEVVANVSPAQTYAPYMLFMGNLFRKKRAVHNLGTGSLGLLTPNQLRELFAETNMNFVAMPPAAKNMQDLIDREEGSNSESKPSYVFLNTLLGGIPQGHRDIPFVAVPAKDRNPIESHFVNTVLYEKAFVEHVGVYAKTMRSVTDQFNHLAKMVSEKPLGHSKSYLFATLGLAGTLFFSDSFSYRSVLPGLFGLGLGGWALTSDIFNRWRYQRNCSALLKAAQLANNTVLKNPQGVCDLSVLQKIDEGVSDILRDHRIVKVN